MPCTHACQNGHTLCSSLKNVYSERTPRCEGPFIPRPRERGGGRGEEDKEGRKDAEGENEKREGKMSEAREEERGEQRGKGHGCGRLKLDNPRQTRALNETSESIETVFGRDLI